MRWCYLSRPTCLPGWDNLGHGSGPTYLLQSSSGGVTLADTAYARAPCARTYASHRNPGAQPLIPLGLENLVFSAHAQHNGSPATVPSRFSSQDHRAARMCAGRTPTELRSMSGPPRALDAQGEVRRVPQDLKWCRVRPTYLPTYLRLAVSRQTYLPTFDASRYRPT